MVWDGHDSRQLMCKMYSPGLCLCGGLFLQLPQSLWLELYSIHMQGTASVLHMNQALVKSL